MTVFSRPIVIVPAIDLRGGRCVRLAQGDPARETRYDENPLARARAFVAAGAQRLHVVDLDGAFGQGENLEALRTICAGVDVPVQTGGGVRSPRDVEQRLEMGASFVIVGTLLVEDPAGARALVERFAEKIIGGVDARAGKVAVRGWLEEGGRDRDELIIELASWGLKRIVFTEIARDGMGGGYDLAALAHVASLTAMHITASGGAHALEDLRALSVRTPSNVDHAILGRALYEGSINLEEALAAS